MRAVPGRVVMAIATVALTACGGDSSTAPPPPHGTANQVPRVLAITSANGKGVPAIVYTSRDGTTDTRIDSASATLQDDSMLVVRTSESDLPHGTKGSGVPWSFTGAGVLDASGVAVFHYTDGPPDTVHVLPDGGVVAALSIRDHNLSVPFATVTFTSPYHGVALNPIMRVRGFSPAQVAIGSGNLTVVIVGSNFMPATTVAWGSASLHVTYTSASQIAVDVPAALLATGGTVPITLTNPGPGGGLRVYSYDVVAPMPVITAINPATIFPGTGPVTLQVTGSAFTPQSVVQWDGAPRPTTYVSATQLTATITAGDVSVAGAGQVTVKTPPPGGGTSNVAGFAIVGTPVPSSSEIDAKFPTLDIVADPVRPMIYAEGMVDPYASSVVAIDATTGKVAWSMDMGNEISCMAISDDGQYLYVAHVIDGKITRIALATLTVDLTLSVGSGSSVPLVAHAMRVLPGSPRSVAVLRSAYNAQPGPEADLVAYDDAVPRANRLTGPVVPLSFAFASSGVVYGVTGGGSAEEIAIDASGASVQRTPFTGLHDDPYMVMGTRVYGYSGTFHDMATGATGTLPGFVASYAITHSADDRVIYTAGGPGQFIRAYDVAQQTTAMIPIASPLSTSPMRMVRSGADGLAFSTGFDLYVVRASVVH